jgi:hypothetical protein
MVVLINSLGLALLNGRFFYLSESFLHVFIRFYFASLFKVSRHPFWVDIDDLVECQSLPLLFVNWIDVCNS